MQPGDIDLGNIFSSYKTSYIQHCEEYAKFNNLIHLNTASDKPKAIWKKINEVTGRHKHYQSQDKPSCDDLSLHFATLGNTANQGKAPVQHTLGPTPGKTFFFNPTSPEEVLSCIGKLKPKKTKDHFDMDTQTLKDVAPSISEILAIVINKCIVSGVFPDKMKIAKVTPVFKKGARDDVSNYRPISVLPAFSKIFESIMTSRVTDFFNRQKYFNVNQYGFRAGRGTEDAIMSLISLITDTLERGEQCNALFLDLSKAFDSMCHTNFLIKMEHYGFRGTPLKLLKSYLSNRLQYVVHNGKSSAMRSITSGVAQGSLTGALFFVIYTNDLPNGITGNVLQYADDTTLLVHGQEPDILRASQNALQEADDWFSNNKLVLNQNKTTELFITSSRGDQREAKSVKFLGIRLDTRLTWKAQVEGLLPILASAVYAIKRIKSTINTTAARSTYYALFHSRMSYGLKIWGASAHTTRILLVQKRAVRAIEDAGSTDSCRPLFIKHRIMTIYATYAVQQLLHAKKHLTDYKKRQDIHGYNTRQNQQLEVPFRRLHTTTFTSQAVVLFNKLPHHWKDLPSRAFKRRISSELTTIAPYSLEEVTTHLTNIVDD